MTTKKYYAVKNGRSVGIFTSWDECKKQINGFSGAIYKSFATLQEAEEYLYDGNYLEANENWDGPIAYVDGSFDDKSGQFAAGAVILYQDKEIKLSQKFNDAQLASMRNVAGEICAARMVMEYALDEGWQQVRIYHDYQGIASWCDGSWQANLKGTKDYRDYYQSIKDKLQISFVKVKAHSNNKYNDLADSLARKALGK